MLPKLTDYELGWLVGLLEGEGCFYLHAATSPAITVGSTDIDVIQKVHKLMQLRTSLLVVDPPSREGSNRQIMYKVNICGSVAKEWMENLQPLMSQRRAARIGLVLKNINIAYVKAPNLGMEAARQIRILWAEGNLTQRSIGKLFKVSQSTIYKVISNISYKE